MNNKRAEKVALSLLRDFDKLGRIEGLLANVGGDLWIVRKPDRDNWNLEQLYKHLRRGFTPETLQNALNPTELVRVDREFLARWQYHRKRVHVGTLKKLVSDGIRPVKHLQNVDLQERISRYDVTYKTVQKKFHSLERDGALSDGPHDSPDALRTEIETLFSSSVADAFFDYIPKDPIPFNTLWEMIVDAGPEQAIDVLESHRFDTHGWRSRIRRAAGTERLKEICEACVTAQLPEKFDFRSRKASTWFECAVLFPEYTELLKTFSTKRLRQLKFENRENVRAALQDVGHLKPTYDQIVLLANTAPRKHYLKALALKPRILRSLSKEGLSAYFSAIAESNDPPFAEEDWFVEFFYSPSNWRVDLARTLLSDRKYSNDVMLRILASRTMASRFPRMAAELDKWNAAELAQKPERFADVVATLGLPSEQVESYLYYRRATGEGATFAKSILKPLEFDATERNKLAYLESSPNVDEHRDAIAALKDPDRREARKAHAIQIARKTFDRALADLKIEALRKVVDRLAADVANQVFRARLQMPTETMLALMYLIHDNQIDEQVLRRAFHTLNDETSFADWPENRQFIAGARFNTDAWVAGFDVDRDGYQIHTETDPKEVLKMGSYFHSCLSLEGGMNRATTLSNMVDINKHVVYARTKSGAVVARKLIGVNQDGKLVGYQTFQKEEHPIAAAALIDEVESFAIRCGLDLSTLGAPKSLTGAFWYDDLTVDWHHEHKPSISKEGETNIYLQAATDDDWETLGSVADYGGEFSSAAKLTLWRKAEDLPDQLKQDYTVRSIKMCGYDLRRAFDDYTAPDQCKEIAQHVIGLTSTHDPHDSPLAAPNPAYHVVDTAMLMKLLERYLYFERQFPSECLEWDHPDCQQTFVEQAANLFLVKHVNGDDISRLTTWLKAKEPLLRLIAFRVYSFTECETRDLIRANKNADNSLEFEMSAMAIANQGETRLSVRFKNAFEQDPNRFLGYALWRIGETDTVREHWHVDPLDQAPESLFLNRRVAVQGKEAWSKFLNVKSADKRMKRLHQLAQIGVGIEPYVKGDQDLRNFALAVRKHRALLWNSKGVNPWMKLEPFEVWRWISDAITKPPGEVQNDLVRAASGAGYGDHLCSVFGHRLAPESNDDWPCNIGSTRFTRFSDLIHHNPDRWAFYPDVWEGFVFGGKFETEAILSRRSALAESRSAYLWSHLEEAVKMLPYDIAQSYVAETLAHAKVNAHALPDDVPASARTLLQRISPETA